mmetsp:Transcript_11749/g.18747  ORF Transcript_11749/g.18747 Transcript_11749/m.18747 type:complete len:161 (-) Transcript_11749:101-583(-)
MEGLKGVCSLVVRKKQYLAGAFVEYTRNRIDARTNSVPANVSRVDAVAYMVVGRGVRRRIVKTLRLVRKVCVFGMVVENAVQLRGVPVAHKREVCVRATEEETIVLLRDVSNKRNQAGGVLLMAVGSGVILRNVSEWRVPVDFASSISDKFRMRLSNPFK